MAWLVDSSREATVHPKGQGDLGWFLLAAAQAEESQALIKESLKDVRVEDIMSRDPVVVPASVTLDSFIEDYVMKQPFSTYPIDDHGEVVGVVTLSRIKGVPPEQRSGLTVAEVGCPMEETPKVTPADEAAVALQQMQECSDGRALVMTDGHLVGIVSPRDVQRALERAGLRGAAWVGTAKPA